MLNALVQWRDSDGEGTGARFDELMDHMDTVGLRLNADILDEELVKDKRKIVGTATCVRLSLLSLVFVFVFVFVFVSLKFGVSLSIGIGYIRQGQSLVSPYNFVYVGHF